jgi:uracil-DNA glycosylase
MKTRGISMSPKPVFGHCLGYAPESGPAVIASYHPSQQNTFTGKLTPDMLEAVFQDAARRIR